jgi:hypothetical protein
MDTSKYLGLTKKSAQNKAENAGLIFRLIRIDGESFLDYPKDDEKRDDRICIEIDSSQVTKAIIS